MCEVQLQFELQFVPVVVGLAAVWLGQTRSVGCLPAYLARADQGTVRFRTAAASRWMKSSLQDELGRTFDIAAVSSIELVLVDTVTVPERWLDRKARASVSSTPGLRVT